MILLLPEMLLGCRTCYSGHHHLLLVACKQRLASKVPPAGVINETKDCAWRGITFCGPCRPLALSTVRELCTDAVTSCWLFAFVPLA